MKILLTGASGFLGGHLVRALVAQGHQVRALIRSRGRAAPLRALGAEVYVGDLVRPEELTGIAEGTEVIYHLASAMRGSWRAFEQVDIEGTKWLLREAVAAHARRFIYAGTLHGYPLAVLRDDSTVDERVPLDSSGLLGNYARAKQRVEELVLDASREGAIEGVIVRPGLVCGAGTAVLSAHVGQSTPGGVLLLFGDGGVPLPLTYVDNTIDALLLAAVIPGIAGEAFNIVDDEVVTQREYLQLLQEEMRRPLRILRLPRGAYFMLGWASELAAALTKKEPATNRYRVRGRFRRVRWDTSKAKRVLGWQPRVPLREGLRRAFRAHADHQPAR